MMDGLPELTRRLAELDAEPGLLPMATGPNTDFMSAVVLHKKKPLEIVYGASAGTDGVTASGAAACTTGGATEASADGALLRRPLNCWRSDRTSPCRRVTRRQLRNDMIGMTTTTKTPPKKATMPARTSKR